MTWSTASYEPVLSTLSIDRAGQPTRTESESWSEPSLLVPTSARLLIVPQSPASVVPWMWTVQLPFEGSEASVHVRTSGFWAVSIEQLTPALLPVGASAVQTMPAGRLSVTVTPSAVPSPVLVTLMSKPISPPTRTGPAGLADFSTLIVA